MLNMNCASELFAQYQNVGAFATRGSRGRTPLSVKYDLSVTPGMNLGFVNVTVTDPSGPSKNDRNLVAVLYVKAWGSSDASCIAYRQRIQLAEGATTATIEIPFPALQSQISWDVAIFEDDRDIEDTRNKKSNLNQQDYHWSYMGNQPAALVQIAGLQATKIDPAVKAEESKAISEYSNAKWQAANNNTPGGSTNFVSVSALTSVDLASPDWRHYLPHPVWVASPTAIAELMDTRPDAAQALRTFLVAGGVLLVYDVQAEDSLAKVDAFLGGGEATRMNAWHESAANAPVNLSMSSPAGVDDATREEAAMASMIKKLSQGTRNLTRDVGLGHVTVCNRSIGELLKMDYFNKFTIDTYSPIMRTTPSHDGSWFWQNLILQVGKPPVLSFCAIVTLFGGVLGPGLLYFTGRMQRRSLMIFLVPAVSLIATLAIVTYGVLYEGFETHVRINSVTSFDAPSKSAFAWSRQNYFSGLPPREGLQFSHDAIVRNVAENDRQRYSGTPSPRSGITATVTYADRQIWHSWLKPRQHQQLFVGHKVNPAAIPISVAKADAGAVKLTNLTSSLLPFVALRGESTDYFVATDVGPKTTVELQPQDRDSVAVIVGRIGADFKPTMPPELASGGDSLLNFGNSARYSRTFVAQTDVISDAYKRYLTDEIELQPFAFATLVPEFSAIEMPIQGAQADNVNLVIGVKPW